MKDLVLCCGGLDSGLKSDPSFPATRPRRIILMSFPLADCSSHPFKAVVSKNDGMVGCSLCRGRGW